MNNTKTLRNSCYLNSGNISSRSNIRSNNKSAFAYQEKKEEDKKIVKDGNTVTIQEINKKPQ